MLRSYIIEIDGIFAGAAILQSNGKFRFVPTDTRVRKIRDILWSNLSELRREARLLLGSRQETTVH